MRTAEVLAALVVAVERYQEDYRTEGCTKPDCIVCQRSKAAADALDAAMAQAKEHAHAAS